MTQIYNVPLTQDQRDYLISLCATASDDDAVAQETLGECGMDRLEDALRNAETAEEDALQRLEEWRNANPERGYSLRRGCLRPMRKSAPILADAINAALDAAEGAEDA